MAIEVFTNMAGVSTAFISSGIPMIIILDGWGGYLFFKSIVTSISVESSSNVNFTNSLNDLIYFFNFGEKMGDLTVSGMAFSESCVLPTLGYHGADFVNLYFVLQRASTRMFPMIIAFGGSLIFLAFLIKSSIRFTDPQKNIAEFTLTFKVNPHRTIYDYFF